MSDMSACTERADGTKEWWVNGKLHREDGPAVERADGSKAWWINGELHREGMGQLLKDRTEQNGGA